MRKRLIPSGLQAALLLMMVVALVATGCSDATADGLTIGDDAPGFELPTASGSTVSLDEYAGAPALLYFHMADG